MIGLCAAGVGTVTKGVGFLPLLVLLPWMALPRRHPSVLPARALAGRSWLLVLPAFVAGTAVWLGPLGIALLHSPDPALHAYAHELLFKQTGTRYAHAWHHVKPFWYYLQVIATLWLPGCLLLPWLVPAWWRRLRRGDPRLLLLLAWSLLVLVFFSASPGKREVYIFPMLPALCVAAAPLLPGLLRRRGVQRLLLGYVLLLGVAALALGGGIGLHLHWAERSALQRGIALASLQTMSVWLIGLGLVALGLVAWARGRRAGSALVAATAALWTVTGLGVMPALDPYSSSAALMQRVGERIGPHAGWACWRGRNRTCCRPTGRSPTSASRRVGRHSGRRPARGWRRRHSGAGCSCSSRRYRPAWRARRWWRSANRIAISGNWCRARHGTRGATLQAPPRKAQMPTPTQTEPTQCG